MLTKKILIADDSPTALLMTRSVVSRLGCAIVTAKDGAEAVTKALEEKPDLILLDVVMPNLDGFGACRRLRAEAATRATPILMLTTRGEEVNVQEGYAAGCTDYLTKPINGSELVEKIKRLLGTAG